MKVLVLRPKELLESTLEMLRKEGFEACGCPFVEIRPLEFQVPEHDYAIVTSQNAARILCEKKVELKRVVAIGKKTAEVLRKCGYDVLTPSSFDSKTLVEEFRRVLSGKKVVAIRSNAGSDVLRELSKICDFREVVAYEIRKVKGEEQIKEVEKVRSGFYDFVVFSSSMIAENFFELYGDGEIPAKLIAIGPPTAKKIESFGFKAVMPDEYTFDGIVRLLKSLKDGDFRC